MPTFVNSAIVAYSKFAFDTFSNIRAATTGLGSDSTNIILNTATIGISPFFQGLQRIVMSYDTSTLETLLVDNIISSATIQVKIGTKTRTQNLLGDTGGGFSLVESLIKTSTLNTSKYRLSNLNLTLLADSFNYSDIIDGSIMTFDLNDDGINSIVTNGTSAFAIIFNADFNNSAAWADSATILIPLDKTFNQGSLLTVNIIPFVPTKSFNFAGGIGYRRRRRPFNPASIDII